MAARETTERTTEPRRIAGGIIVTAGIGLVLAGLLSIMQGIEGLVSNELYVSTQNWVFKLDTTAWGWIQILIGVVAFFAGLGLFWRKVWPRTIAVIVAVASIIANLLWLPYYALSALLLIAFNSFVIWAVTEHSLDINE